MMKDFVYDSLYFAEDFIRLVQILPGSPGEEIQCQINQFSALKCPPYCAISYCWGESDQRRRIMLNDQQFFVRENLWWLLYHLRLANETRKLWIDAICIDQASIKERNHQVGLMGTIFERAETVLAWLGKASEDSHLAMDLLTSFPNITQPAAIKRHPIRIELSTGRSILFGAYKDSQPDILKNFPHMNKPGTMNWRPFTTELSEGQSIFASSVDNQYESETLEEGTLDEAAEDTKREELLGNEKWAALANLCRREYWYRTWIIQELLLARKIDLMCGDSKVSWKALEHIANVIRLESMDMIECSGVKKTVKIADSLPFRFVEQRVKQQPEPLGTLLYAYQDSKCIDPRDKVYAMLSLASDSRIGGTLLADYSKDVCQVYIDVMQFCRDVLSRDGLRFSFLVLKILDITPNVAAAFLNEQYKSGWLPLQSMHRLDYSNKTPRNKANLVGGTKVSGKFVGWVSTVDLTPRETKSKRSFFNRLSSEAVKMFSGTDIKRHISFSSDPFSVCYAPEVDYYTDDDSCQINSADDETSTNITIRYKENRRGVGIACGQALPGHLVYQLDKAGLTLLFSETERGIRVVGEAIVNDDPDFNTLSDQSDVQRFEINALDLLAIIRRGGKVDAGDEHGWTALPATAWSRHKAVARLEHEKGLETDAGDGDGRKLLFYAASHGHEAVVRLLIERGTAFYPIDEAGETALHLASVHGHEAIVRLLLEHGAAVNLRDRDGQTPFDHAVRRGHQAVMQVLLETGLVEDEGSELTKEGSREGSGTGTRPVPVDVEDEYGNGNETPNSEDEGQKDRPTSGVWVW